MCKKKYSAIGTRNESSLHKTLKFQYAGPGGKTEAVVGEFVADALRRDGEYIEVQTGSFAPLKKKVKEIAANSASGAVSGKVRGRRTVQSCRIVRIIHPVAVTKVIEVYSPLEKLLYRRKSPVHGSIWNIFDALLYAPELPLINGVKIEIVLCDITEKRVKDGKGSWRRKGISIKDKELSAWRESVLLSKPADYLRFVPFKKSEEFTVSSMAEKAEISRITAQKTLYVLTKMKIVKKTGKKGNAWVYKRK